MAVKTWDGSTGNWSTAASWTGGTLPANGDDVILPGSAGGYALTLDVDTASLDALQIGDGASAGLIDLFIGAHALNVNGGANSITVNEPGGTNIVLASGSINADTLGLVGANQIVSGSGTLTVGTINGSGTLGAVGGVLDVVGTISAGISLTIDTSAGSTLKIDGTATAGAAISMNNANQTLEIGGAGNLTIAAAESITNGTIKLDGSGSVLTAGGGLTLGAGASLVGQGSVTLASLSGSGTLTAAGGTLTLTQSLGSSTGIGFQVASSSDLEVNGVVSTGNTFTFVNNSGNSGNVGIGDDTGMNATFSNMFVATGVTPTDTIDIEGHTVSIVSVTGSGTTSGTITLSDGAVINLTNLTSTSWFADTAADSGTGTIVFVSDTACYRTGTLIQTDRGELPVEQLAIGDRVVTLSGEPKPIKWIGYRAYGGRFVGGNRSILPIRIMAGALGDGVPARDLQVSPGHALYINGVLVPAELLVNAMTIVQEENVSDLEYFHIELEHHEILLAEGAPAESYVDCENRGMFLNADGFAALYPAKERPLQQFCASRLEPHSPELAEIRTALSQRAEALGYTLECDPDLHLIVDGKSIRALSVEDGVYRFWISAVSGPIWLASRSAIPAQAGAFRQDGRRRLGVPIQRIRLHGEQLQIDVSCGHPSLRDGFHQDEREHRWTDGMARLPDELFSAFVGGLAIEVCLQSIPLRYPIGVVRDTTIKQAHQAVAG